ncbi:tripartite tricarboxylate transporter permease [Paracoccus onubensis]|uniref:Tripartite tricarboxylate transporter permease n=1 Tax=Paracoccus onubensis TaxID=1675788 RepID=A0A418SN43_9RHOB|nr:tripartite tricarboxylate transporter permease [Paracoccus onubensis]RJE82365.1 tripartite tricarboxylate transporter permease [Paracoccus onubensis]
MDLLNNLALGLQTTVQWHNLLYCFVGVFLGTAIGVLPGLGPLATIAMLLPLTFQMSSPESALIMLAGIYYGAQYGGSTTAILVNLPGETSSAVTALDGYQMARQGRAGVALAIAALSSFFAGTIATILIAIAATPMAALAFQFGPAEYFSLMILGLIAAVVLAHGSVLKALGMVILGLLLGMVGTDVNSGVPRYSFGLPQLVDGLEIAAIAIGVFGFAEVISNLDERRSGRPVTVPVGRLIPRLAELKEALLPAIRGTIFGSILGVLPGGGATLSSFTSYATEKKLSKKPENFGRGALAGVAGPEAANNAGAQTSFIPMLTLGLPSNPVMALMIAALMIHSIQPGPQVMTSNPVLFWGLIASMWIGNLMLVILNLPLVGLWVRMLQIPYRILFPSVLMFCVIGVFSMSNSTFDVWITLPFAALGYLWRRLGCEPAPLLLGMVLGPMMEEYLRRAMILSRGDWTVFVTEPLSCALLLLAAILILLVMLPSIRRTRKDVFADSDD